MYVCMYVCTYVCVCVYVCMYVCMYAYMRACMTKNKNWTSCMQGKTTTELCFIMWRLPGILSTCQSSLGITGLREVKLAQLKWEEGLRTSSFPSASVCPQNSLWCQLRHPQNLHHSLPSSAKSCFFLFPSALFPCLDSGALSRKHPGC